MNALLRLFLQYLNCSYNSILFAGNITEHQKTKHSFIKNPHFWARSERNMSKQRQEEIKRIWNELKKTDCDILLILYSLSELVGKERN